MREQQPKQCDPAPTLATSATQPAPRNDNQGLGLAQIQRVIASGWDAVVEMASVALQNPKEWPAIMHWLQVNRGNGFATKVAHQVKGTSSAKHSTRFPIILIHGFNAGPSTSFGDQIPATLRADGDAVYTLALPPFQSVEERAKVIAQQLEAIMAKTGARKVNLVGHSQGGLDARYLVSTMGWSDRVASVTTVATPHRGSPLADMALTMSPSADAYGNRFARWLGQHVHESPLSQSADLRGNAKSLSVANATQFNATNRNVPGVFYQSWAGVSSVMGDAKPGQKGTETVDRKQKSGDGGDRLNPLLYPAAMIMAAKAPDQPNDGVVTVDSAKWGQFNGVLPADHLDLEGIGGFDGDKPRTGFDARAFYVRMARDLAKRGY
ncbi:MAG: alpha/beta fold hydrolase [Kofleriaceae bacterium]|nr:alpha/beta fold hydrolase [Kofleriaceae bacterium]